MFVEMMIKTLREYARPKDEKARGDLEAASVSLLSQ